MQSLRNTQVQKLSHELRAEISLWNKKLRQPCPLAPSSLKGKVVPADYARENAEFGRWVSEFMTKELHRRQFDHITEMARSFGDIICHQTRVRHLGIGEGADLGYFLTAITLGFEPVACDFSNVAIKNGRRKVRGVLELIKAAGICYYTDEDSVVQDGEIEDAAGDIACDSLVGLVQVSRVLQFLKPDKLERTLVSLGKWLQHKGTTLVVVHPYREENPMVEFGASTPYSWEEIASPLRAGAGAEVRQVSSSRHKYFGQAYTASTISAT